MTIKGVIRSHVNYFSPKTLSALAERAGFQEKEVVTDRWKYKYSGLLKMIASFTDPLMNATGIGGLLYIGIKK